MGDLYAVLEIGIFLIWYGMRSNFYFLLEIEIIGAALQQLQHR